MAADGPRVTSVHTLPAIQVDVPQEHHHPLHPLHHHPPPSHPPQHYPHRTRPSYANRRSVTSYSTIPASSGSSSGPMAIPNARDQHSPPPPLPPPRHLIDPDLAVRYGRERGEEPKTLPPIRPGSSLLAGLGRSLTADGSQAHALVRRPRRTSASNEIFSSGDKLGGPTQHPQQQQQHQQQLMQQQQRFHQDEGYASLPSSGPNMHPGSRLKVQEPSVGDSQSWMEQHDRRLLDKLNAGPSEASSHHTLNTTLRPAHSSGPGASAVDASSLQRLHADLKGDRRDPRTMLPLPDHRHPSSPEPTMPCDNGPRRSSTSVDSGVGMHGMQMPSMSRSFRSPRPTPRQSSGLSSVPEVELTQVGEREHRHHTYRSRSGSLLAPRGDGMNQSPATIFDQMIYAEPENESSEESQMRRLRLGESERTPPRARRYSPNSKAGQKRRASSPPREHDDRHSTLSPATGNSNELFHRRSSGHLLGRRTPPLSRFPHSSLSSASSVTRASSTVSSTGMTLITNSLTSLASSHDRLSPSGHSPGSELGSSSGSPCVRSSSLNPSPRDAPARTAHHRATSEVKVPSGIRTAPRHGSTISDSQGLSRRPVVLLCDCCPKKPRRFDTADELRIHQTEKQYSCQYCNNRFKNKNEMERHQNSLHLRRHSWSCAALRDIKDAFHSSPYKAGTVDVCGYCGAEFSATPADWDARVEHLNNVHKFGECNQAKKFFRADHFRQHLKHSHAGTSGKWTNMLENACMKDEPPPQPIDRTGSSGLEDGSVGSVGGERGDDRGGGRRGGLDG
ncbi:MAG: hypothetical protein M1823_001408 [Watsoniomyces obsoletus]|nr:MAG: hypothetical protein M1823_001408 [Watsoniomyces obsoletus]